MSKTAFSVYLYGLYLVLSAGLPLMIAPEVALGVLKVTVLDPTWVRMFGVVTLILGGIYILSVHSELEAFYGWSVPARYLTAGFAIAMIVLGKIAPGYLLAVAIDVISASLTWVAIRYEGGAAAAENPSSGVERNLAKVEVVSSNLIARCAIRSDRFVPGVSGTNATVMEQSEAKPGRAPPATPNQTSTWLFAALFLMAAATLVSVATTFYLYRWRKILLANPTLIVPEEFGTYLKGLGNHVGNLTRRYDKHSKQIDKTLGVTASENTKMVDTYMTLQKALDEKDDEIKRFKSGYDSEIFRKFLSRFIRVDQTVGEFIQDDPGRAGDLKFIKRLLEDALDECGVDVFEPEIGSDFRTEPGVDDNPKSVDAPTPDDDFKIAEVLEAGYRVKSADSHTIIVPAKVSIYRTKE